MLSAAIFVPLAAALLLALWRPDERSSRSVAVAASAVPLALLGWAWLRYDPAGDELFQLVEQASWIPSVGAAYRVGVDGISLSLAAMSAVLFLAATAFRSDTLGRAPAYYGWLLFLEAACLGLFLALDLLLFYVFFDLTLVGMYFLIGNWGHGDSQRSALKFFLYTFVGSLSVLLAILGLYLSADPHTFDMASLIESQPMAGPAASVVLFGFLFGFAIKTPLIPVHTWLPPAHVDAPAPASAILAGVLLKIGTFGMIRIPLAMMPETFSRFATGLAILAVVSVVYGALVSLGQSNLKTRIAYTSVVHMGLVVLGVAVAAAAGDSDAATRQLALSGAGVGMVSHGIITGALFLITGVFWQRTADYDMNSYGGLGGRAPRLAAVAIAGALAGIGLPGSVQFIADFQILASTVGAFPVLAVVALLGLLILAALFLQLLQKVFLGPAAEAPAAFGDLDRVELATIGGLLVLSIVLGVFPGLLLFTLESAAGLLVGAL